jgi:predicted transcriptional regulator
MLLRSVSIALTVREVMERNVAAIGSHQPVLQAIEKMIQEGVWSLLVETQGLPVGVITDRDILRRCAAMGHYPDKLKVEEIMSSPIITIEANVGAGEALKTMIDKNVKRLYVVEGGKVIGRVTHTGLIRNLLDVMSYLSHILSPAVMS